MTDTITLNRNVLEEMRELIEDGRALDVVLTLDSLLAQPAQQESVATVQVMGSVGGVNVLGCLLRVGVNARVGDKLYTAPQERKPLTPEQIDEAIQQHVNPVATYRRLHDFARAIEAAHGITGSKT